MYNVQNIFVCNLLPHIGKWGNNFKLLWHWISMECVNKLTTEEEETDKSTECPQVSAHHNSSNIYTKGLKIGSFCLEEETDLGSSMNTWIEFSIKECFFVLDINERTGKV